MHSIDEYVSGVLDGRIVANRWIRRACERHQRDLLRDDLVFDFAAADSIIDFYPTFLRLYDGIFKDEPFKLTPHQVFIVGSIFGWKHRDSGYRRYRIAYIEEAKGQGKSPLAAGIGLYGLLIDGEQGAEIYSAAVTKEQAGIIFRDAKIFAENSPPLSQALIIDKLNLAYSKNNSFFRPVSSEHRGLDGKRPHIVLIDEIHEHPNDLVISKMTAGLKGRSQPLIFEITNSGYDRNSVCFQHRQYTESVLTQRIEDDTWFGIMSGLDPCPQCERDGKQFPVDDCPDCDDMRNPEVWEKANPNIRYLGKPFSEYLGNQVLKAYEMPAQCNIVKRLNFCVWTDSATRWIPAHIWDECADTYGEAELFGRPCYMAIDLSSNLDLTAEVLVFLPTSLDPVYRTLCRFFLPSDSMYERVKRDKVPYDVWARQGYITCTPGNIVDFAFVLSQIGEDTKKFDVRELSFDRWGSPAITNELQNMGFCIEGNERLLVQFGQGYQSMSPAIDEVERGVYAKNLRHNNNPVLNWNMSNVVLVSNPAGFRKFDKDKSTERIDGVVALAMARGRAVRVVSPKKKSIYETRGVKSFG